MELGFNDILKTECLAALEPKDGLFPFSPFLLLKQICWEVAGGMRPDCHARQEGSS